MSEQEIDRQTQRRCLDEIGCLYDFLVAASGQNGCRIQVVVDDVGGTEMIKLTAERCREILEGVRLAGSAVLLMSDTEETP